MHFTRRRTLSSITVVHVSLHHPAMPGCGPDGLVPHRLRLYLITGPAGASRHPIAIKVFVASVDDMATRALFDEMLERLPLVSRCARHIASARRRSE
jgi:hypothetical protein